LVGAAEHRGQVNVKNVGEDLRVEFLVSPNDTGTIHEHVENIKGQEQGSHGRVVTHVDLMGSHSE
jgi:hypothetical protein